MKRLFLAFTLLALAIGMAGGITSCNNRQPDALRDQAQESAKEQDETPGCEDIAGLYALLVSPRNPAPGKPFRILAVGDGAIRSARLQLVGGEINQVIPTVKEGTGPPCWVWAEATVPVEGLFEVSIELKGRQLARYEIEVSSQPEPIQPGTVVWKTKQGWDGEMELFFSAWIAALFHNAAEGISWTALHEVTQSPRHNFLHNHLGLLEDEAAARPTVVMEPDCADNPYFLRAYFAWKMGLPFGYHEADRGWLGKAPQTGRWITNETPATNQNPVLTYNAFLRRVMNGVHSGSARTALSNERSDYYPVPLMRASLRPGVVFADPYGHTFVLVRWIAQTRDQPGTLLAVDAQPDGTVAVKRFWKGNFLFNTHEVVGEPGFKAFRPIVVDEGALHLLTSGEIDSLSGISSFSLQQKSLPADVFYRTMERIISPKPMDPEMVLLDLIRALHEQLLARVQSVANGEKYLQSHPGTVIPMPGREAGVFLAGGAWEDFSTPNRDLRLLIAMDAVLGFPEQVRQFPEDFRVGKMANIERVVTGLRQTISRKTADLSITYQRSDSSDWTLTLATILARREAFEMAYNPNDCVEIRWGAPEGSDEYSTARRKAPASQRSTMLKVRGWFQKRLHPPT